MTLVVCAVAVSRLRQRETPQDIGLLICYFGLAAGLVVARPEVAALLDSLAGVPLSSLTKRLCGGAAALGVILFMSGVAAQRNTRGYVYSGIAVMALLAVTYVAGAYRWAETADFFADPARFDFTSTWAPWVHFLAWYIYLGAVMLFMTAICASAARKATGPLRTQLWLMSIGSVVFGLSPVYSLAGIAGLIHYDLGVDRAAFIMPGTVILVLGMTWQAAGRRLSDLRAWWLYTRLSGLWKLLTTVNSDVVLQQLKRAPWQVRLHRRVVECQDALRDLLAYSPAEEGEDGGDMRKTAVRMQAALAAKEAGAAKPVEVGPPATVGESVTEEAKWLIKVWSAWRRLQRRQPHVETVSPGR
ncbi:MULTISPECIES: MAB_1171c family putative transporter [unclassified Nonomuraea]|uniref:MAB_1171c family putative transporter n=1 Tax=unclassified Nonomuraea TaxID=2593643 RepID=UPI0034048FB6